MSKGTVREMGQEVGGGQCLAWADAPGAGPFRRGAAIPGANAALYVFPILLPPHLGRRARRPALSPADRQAWLRS